MNTILKIAIILGGMICLVPIVFWGIILFFTYVGAVFQSMLGTDEKGTFIIIGFLLLLGFFGLYFKSKKNNSSHF